MRVSDFINSLEGKSDSEARDILDNIFNDLGNSGLYKAYFELNQERDLDYATTEEIIAFLQDFDNISQHGARGGYHGLIYCDGMDRFFGKYRDDFIEFFEQDSELVDFIKEKYDFLAILCGSRYELVQMVAEQLAWRLCDYIESNCEEVA